MRVARTHEPRCAHLAFGRPFRQHLHQSAIAQLAGDEPVGISIIGNATGSTANLADAVHAIALAGIRPVIDTTFAFEAVPEAYRYLESAAHVGKVAITF